MAARTLTAALALVLGLVTFGFVPASPPAGAAPEIELSMVSGEIDLRGSSAPSALATPTTFTADQDGDGVITGGSFATPAFTSEIPITVPVTTTSEIDAELTQITPGAATGSVDEAGVVEIDLEMALDVHIEYGFSLSVDCHATPVEIGLSGTYDPLTERVTLVDEDLTIPEMTNAPTCDLLLEDFTNDLLAGPGHSIELVMEGAVAAPRDVGTTTGLEVSPAPAREGDLVTLTAQVAQVRPAEPLPTGSVEFRDGATVFGTEPIDGGGVAVLSTSTLPVGVRQLSAHYLGDSAHDPSSSPIVATLVAAADVTVAMSSSALIGGTARTATVTIDNPDGADLENASVAVTLARTGPGSASLDADQVEVEWFDGSAWNPVTLTEPGPRELTGTIGAAGGFALPQGDTATVLLRIRALTLANPASASCLSTETACPGPVELTVGLDEVDPLSGTVTSPVVGRAVHPLFLVETTRRATTVSLPNGHPAPHTVRQGYGIDVIAPITPDVAGYGATGLAELYVDGLPANARAHDAPLSESPTAQLPVEGGVVRGQILLPPDIDPGEHELTVRYLGSAVFGPAETTGTFTVLPAVGHPFVCQAPGDPLSSVLGAGIVFDAAVPAAAVAGDPVELDVTTAEIHLGRPSPVDPLAATIDDASTLPVDTGPVTDGVPQLTGISLGLTPDGAGTAESVTRTGGQPLTATYPAGATVVDQVLTLDGATAEVVVEGDPGDVVPIELDEVVLDLVDAAGVAVPIHCVPTTDGPLEVGEIEIAGTTISATPNPADDTDEVTIEAETFPAGAAGTVTFVSDIDGTLGTDPVTAGTASISTDDLSPGDHQIVASFDATDPDVPDTQGTGVLLVTY